MGTRFEKRKDGKINKPPYRIRYGQRVVKADKSNPENWATFAEALIALEDGAVDAVGFVFTDSDPLYVADADEVIDLATGEVDPAALRVIHRLGTYTEVSCSGTGLHAIGRGSKPENARCKSKALGFSLELYDGASGARFMVMTGKPFGTPRDVAERPQALEELCAELWPQKPPKPPRGPRGPIGEPRGETRPVDLDDEALLDRARRARTGPKFRRLYDQGDITANEGSDKSHSGADMSLMNMLIFWTGGDRERMIRLFKASALYRPEEDRKVSLTADEALASYNGSFYEVRPVKKPRQGPPASEAPPKEDDPLDPYLRLLLSPAAWHGKKGASAYKAYTALVSHAYEHGITDGDGNLRIGVDVRTLSEIAGMGKTTLLESSLPYLLKDMKLIRWRRGKGKKAGEFVIMNPKESELLCRVGPLISTHFSGPTQHNPESVVDTLRLLIRMRSGRSKRAKLARLGMVAMFVLVAVSQAPPRGYSVEELSELTGRRKPDIRRVLERLQDANLVEPMLDRFVLSASFRREYQRELRQSGIVASERYQRYRHEMDRLERDKDRDRREQDPDYQRSSADPTPDLFGPEKTKRIVAERAKEDREHRLAEERAKVGVTSGTFLEDEMLNAVAMRWHDLRARWLQRGGRSTESLRLAVLEGPFVFRREASDGSMYVYHERPSEAEEAL